MKIKPVKDIKTKDEARQYALHWQYWQAKKSLTFSEVSEWASYFEKLGGKFNLKKEFKENGII